MNGNAGRYGQLYGRPQAGSRPPSRNDPYAANPYSAMDMAFDAGYREGVTLGQQDQARNTRSNFRNSASYRNGDLGYRQSYGDRNAYRLQFQDGVERGYEDGYWRSQNYNNDPSLPYANRGRMDSGNTRNTQQTFGG